MSGTTIYLSATEPTHYYDRAAKADNQFYLVSYLYLLQRNSLRNIEYRKNENPDHKFLIDSGAHTLQGDDLKAFDLDDYKRYMDNYADWLVNNQQYIHACVELDVESAVGMKQVRKWQEDFFMPFEQAGNNVIYVWHPDRGVPEFEDMCRRHAWVGIAQDFFDSGQELGRFMQVAHRHLTKVHGFGITKITTLLENTFYSVDSTTWKGGEMYGVAYTWDEEWKTIRPITSKAAHQRQAYTEYYKSVGLDPDEVIRGDSRTLTTLALASWKKLQTHIHQKFSRPVYWDFRPPVPEIVKDSDPEAALEYIRSTNMYANLDALDDDGAVIQYTLFSALLNHEYDGIRENIEAFVALFDDLDFSVASIELDEEVSDYNLAKVCSEFATLVLSKALPRVEPKKRTPLSGDKSNSGYKSRDDFPEDGLEFTPYENIY